jgi:energy-coupling factor transport system ATP-binding protein
MIVFESVTYIYPGGRAALRDVSVEIGPGQLVAIVGPNGAGKTTFIKHINGLLKPTSGVVRVFGVDTRYSTAARLSRRVGIVFQNPDHQLFSQSVEEEVAFALRNFGLSQQAIRERVEWALDEFDLSRYRGEPPFSLSGGEKKRLCLACVLAWDPDVIILDEPTAGQDSRHKESLAQRVKMLVSQGKTVILVSHDMEFLWPLQPRLIVLHQGRLVFDGPTTDFFSQDLQARDYSLVEPQLVQLWKGLVFRPDRPFPNTLAARDWLLSRVEVTRGAPPR